MKDGVYINLYKDKANLFVIVNGKLEDGELVTVQDYNFFPSIKKNTLILTFSDVIYLGKL